MDEKGIPTVEELGLNPSNDTNNHDSDWADADLEWRTKVQDVAKTAGLDEKEFMDWRAKMRQEPATEGVKRFYTELTGDYTPGEPIVSNSGKLLDRLTSPCECHDVEGAVSKKDLNPGLYHVVFCISSGSWDEAEANLQRTITFQMGTYKVTFTPTEDELETLGNKEGARVRLPFQAFVSFKTEDLDLKLVTGQDNGSTVILHYVEFQDASQEPNEVDIQIDPPKAPTPVKSLDVYQHEPDSGLFHTKKPAAILKYAVSPSGRYVSTLSRTLTHAQIDLFDLEMDNGESVPVARAVFEWKMGDDVDGEEDKNGYGISVSSAGHVLTVEEKPGVFEPAFTNFLLYTFNPLFTPGDEKSVLKSSKIDEPLTNISVLQPDVRATAILSGATGFGKFIANPSGQGDHFLFCDGVDVQLLSTDKEWKLIYKRTLSENKMATSARILVTCADAGMFPWHGDSGMTIWRTSTGTFLTALQVEYSWYLGISFSEDGAKTCMSGLGTVRIFSTHLGTMLAERGGSGQADFVLGDSQLMCLERGCLVDPGSLLENGSYYTARPEDQLEYTVMPGAGRTRVATTQGSKLSILDLKDMVDSPLAIGCADDCESEPHEVDTEIVVFEGSGDRRFAVCVMDESRIVAGLQEGDNEIEEIFSFSVYQDAKAFFLAQSPFLITVYSQEVSVWQVPVESGNELKLVLYWSSLLPVDKIVATCEHELTLLFTKRVEWTPEATWSLRNVLTKDTAETFFDSFSTLIRRYEDAEEQNRKAIVNYVSLHINSYPVPENPLFTVMGALCDLWGSWCLTMLEVFMSDLLENGEVKWVPLDSYTEGSSPISILLAKTKKQPKVLSLINLLIKHCLDRAYETGDTIYLSPVFGCLDDLMDIFPEVARVFLLDLVYMPVTSRSCIINNHTIAHPPTIRPFWKPNSEPLHLTLNPILQYKFSPFIPSAATDNFTQDLFVASFDSLWPRVQSEAVGMGESSVESKRSWFRTMIDLMLVCIGVRRSHSAGNRNFMTEQFDNPALAALIQYKWNTFGFTAWLIRFMAQSVFYTLVIVASFIQVYADEKNSLLGVFIAIIAMAVFFLWLEFLQGWEHPRLYLTSPYNYLDLAGFILPSIASANQIVSILSKEHHGNHAILSFSIIVIFLHMISELRVFRTVCKYVTIVLQILEEIQIFFVVFAAGILAFSLAFLHLLHGCAVNGCDASSGDFPMNFFGAISSTYFSMGGRYDPVSTELSTDRWDVHIMMMIYFFFTVILMLNVLIALISEGFNKGDESWQQVWFENRLHYVKSAENMSHYVPGLRQRSSWFPREIYYTATSADMEAYRKKYELRDRTKKGDNVDASLERIFAQGEERKKDEVKVQGLSEDVQTMMEEMRENARVANERAQVAEERVEEIQKDLKELMSFLRKGKE